MKKYSESELQELLEKQKRLCAEYLEDSFTEHPFKLDQMVNYAPSPLLPTEEVVTKEDDFVDEKALAEIIVERDLGNTGTWPELIKKLNERFIVKYRDVPSDNNNEGASLASHSCAMNNSIEREIQSVCNEVGSELLRAKTLFPEKFVNQHEAYAVILEEIDELWDEIKKNQRNYDLPAQRKEAIQAAAMLVRLVVELLNDK